MKFLKKIEILCKFLFKLATLVKFLQSDVFLITKSHVQKANVALHPPPRKTVANNGNLPYILKCLNWILNFELATFEMSILKLEFWRFKILNFKSQISNLWVLNYEMWPLRFKIYDLKSEIWNLRFETTELKSEIWYLRCWESQTEIWNLKSGF